jgi:hypothetical protein
MKSRTEAERRRSLGQMFYFESAKHVAQRQDFPSLHRDRRGGRNGLPKSKYRRSNPIGQAEVVE